MSSILFRAIVTPFHLLLDWLKRLFIFFCKVLWKNPNGPFGQSSISLGPFFLIYLFLIGGWLLYNIVLASAVYHCESATVVFQFLSRVQLFAIPLTAAHQASLSFTISQTLLKLTSIELVMPSSHLIFCHLFLLLPSIFPSIRVFSNESGLHIRWSEYQSFGFSLSLFNEYSGLISFRMDWLDLPAAQGTLKSLLQHHNSKVSNIQHLAFFMIQLSHPYMTTGKSIALTVWTFVSKVMSLLFNTLNRFVIAFLPRSKRLLISWLQSPFAVILEPPKINSVTVSIVSPSICHEVMGPDAMIFILWMLSFKPAFSLSSFTFIKRFFSSPLSASSVYLRLLTFLLAILIPACVSSSLAFHMMYSV